MTATRRNVLTGAAALAAGAILPAVVAKAQDADAALLAAAERAAALSDRNAAAQAESRRTYALLSADPEWNLSETSRFLYANAEIARGSSLPREALYQLCDEKNERLYQRHGYRAANDAWSESAPPTRAAILLLAKLRPETNAGAAAKARVLVSVVDQEGVIFEEEITELVLATIIADLNRLAARNS